MVPSYNENANNLTGTWQDNHFTLCSEISTTSLHESFYLLISDSFLASFGDMFGRFGGKCLRHVLSLFPTVSVEVV